MWKCLKCGRSYSHEGQGHVADGLAPKYGTPPTSTAGSYSNDSTVGSVSFGEQSSALFLEADSGR